MCIDLKPRRLICSMRGARLISLGPGLVDFDFPLFKDIPISERWGYVQFWSELFNARNSYNSDNTLTDGSAFGPVFSARDPWFVQSALKWIV
jgi:hypothetical protein